MQRTPAVDFECPSCHHTFGDVTKLRRHTMAMYGCWPRMNEGSTKYRLAIPSDQERAWYEDRVLRERQRVQGSMTWRLEGVLVRVVVRVRARGSLRRRGIVLLRRSPDVRLPSVAETELHLADLLPSRVSFRP